MIKVLCFDLFSTLVDVGSVPLSIGRMTADIFGLEHEQWNALCFSAHHEICEPTEAFDVIQTLIHSHSPLVPKALIQQAVEERQARFDYALTKHIQDDVLQGIEQLKQQNYQLVLVSNASTAEVQAWRDSPLAPLFDHSVFSCAVGLKKPDAKIYQHAYELVSVQPAECLFIGDGGSDELVGAKAAGMCTLLMTRFLKNNKTARQQAHVGVVDGEVESTVEVLEWLAQQSVDSAPL
ncbi:hypothetical protein MNBD_GAMMA23-604 [hydrothermal vent metagenome]|uniref:Uncharacterized protein n=1 Tax=hydrothermal vent metagenome TaxID=652676 RepID=A0A3B1AE15_9ZZZZ